MPQQNARGEGRPDDEHDGGDVSAARARTGRPSDDELTLLQAELALLRERVGDAPARIVALEAQLAALQQELEGSVAQNGRLAETLRTARARVAELKAEVERLTAPPHTIGTYVGPGDGGTLLVTVQGRKVQVAAAPDVPADGLEVGQEVVLNDGLQVVAAGAFDDGGELLQVAEVLEDGRILVVGRGDEERIVRPSGRLAHDVIRAGDTLLVDVRSGTAVERVERSDVERLVLEEVPTSATRTSAASVRRSPRSVTPSSCPTCMATSTAATASPRRRASCSTAPPAAGRR